MNKPQPSREAIGVGIFILIFAAVMAWQTAIIPTGGGYAQVGPTAIPWIIVSMIAILGAVITVQASTGWWIVETEHRPLRIKALAWIAIGLLLNILMIGTLGFVLASSAMFLCVARAFGSTNPARDAGIGFALAFVAYLGFDRLLGYQIGTGLIENLV
jgi:putative tricarboxylic transport membrane protein